MTTGPVDGEFRAQDWDAYKMGTGDPFVEPEPLAAEIAVVNDARVANKAHSGQEQAEPPGCR